MIGEPATVIEVASSSSPRVSVIIPATASQELLLAALRSLSLHGPQHIPFEVIVVVNRSSPSAIADLQARVSGVRFIPSAANLGLAGAANRARAVAAGEILIVLHDDAEVEPGWMEALVDTADTHPEAAVVGSQVLYPDGRLQNAGMILWRDGSTSPPWVGDAPPPAAFAELRQVDYCGTSSLLVRADVLDLVGGFDERFYPVYFVDVDLAMSVRRLGWVVLYQPRSQVRHHRGASGTLRWRSFVSERNLELFVAKWSDALAGHEPGDARDEAALTRAMARAARVDGWARTVVADQSEGRAVATIRSDASYLVEERNLALAYAHWLEAKLDHGEDETRRASSAAADTLHELASLRASARYVPGTWLRFAEGGPASLYQSSATYPPEPWGVWLGGKPFTIVLPLTGAPSAASGGPGTLSLRVEAFPFLADRRRRAPLRVSVDGAAIIDIDETRPGPHLYEGQVPGGGGEPPGQLVVTFEADKAVSPLSLGLSDDARQLGFGLVAISVTAD